MMIANWMKNEPVTSQVVSSRLFPFLSSIPSSIPSSINVFEINVFEFAGTIRRVMPRSAIGRSRTAMKGGEN
jgi:hypothetical protein